VSEAYLNGFGARMIGEQHRDPLFPGAREAIVQLARRDDVALGIATGKSRRGVQRILDREGWAAHFVTIQTADTAPSKPDPGMVLQAMAEAGVGPAETTMIGDTTYDVEMAVAAGARAIGVAWGYHPVPALRSAGAHAIAEDFADVLAGIPAAVAG
jgi:phosphoglycolate phosphatase